MLTLPLILLSALVCLPIAVVAIETLAALLLPRPPVSVSSVNEFSAIRNPISALGLAFPRVPSLCDIRNPLSAIRYSTAVLIPAHNEERGIAATLASIQSQLSSGDRLLVVADNCTDATAAVARAAGAEVIERHSDTEKGKGFALAAGVAHLSAAAPDVVVILDADTLPEAGAIDALARAAGAGGRPIQSLYLLELPHEASPRSSISAFAFCIKNHVRPLGAQRLGIPCHLTGAGMAFSWKIISEAKLATGNIVEDMQLGMELAIAGHSPRFCPQARVLGRLPDTVSAAATQRTRWEHGHLQTILHNCPRLIWQGIRQGRPSLIALALDLAVPPLALLVLMGCVATAAAAGFWWLGLASRTPLLILLAGGATLAASILLAWWRFARQILPAATLAAIPLYILWKIPLYLAFLFRRQKAWIRTAR